MMIERDELNEEQLRIIEHYNPVSVNTSEAVGTVSLAVIALILLFALLRSQRRIRELQEQQGREAEE